MGIGFGIDAMNLKYELRRWCEGQRENLQMHVADQTGRIVFSSRDYDEVCAEKDRLNAGGAERQELDWGNRWTVTNKDGSKTVKILPTEIRPFL
jgi:hypothetical protein